MDKKDDKKKVRFSKRINKAILNTVAKVNIKTIKSSFAKKKEHIGYKFHTSFIFFVIVRIVFFPFFFIRWYFRLMKSKFDRFLLLNVVLTAIITGYISFCYITLPDVSKINDYTPSFSSKFYDRDDKLIYEVGNERRTHIGIEQVPKVLVQAFVAAEDKTFYTNHGIDFSGLTRTVIQDFYKFIRRQRLAGASTITQQVVKNVLLTNEYSLSRKIKELILSYRLSQILPKDKIMEIYLNHIYFGMRAYGISSAAEEYFGKSVAQLTISEMAMLAAMPKAPSSINPFKNYNRAINRRNWVLQRMMEDGYITKDQYEQYSKSELIVKKHSNFYAPFYAPSFFAQNLLTDKTLGITKEDVLNNGYKVELTIDSKMQQVAQQALNRSLENYSKNHGFAGPIYTFSEEDVKTKNSATLLRDVDEPENLGRFQLAVVKSVDNDKVSIGLRDNSDGIILLSDMLWARQKITETQVNKTKITKCSDVLKVGDVVVVLRKTKDSKYYSLEQLPQINGGVLALNPKTGEILAMVGGYIDTAGTFNRTIQAFRQVGSTIKPFVYGMALEKNFTPSSVFMDTDININIGNGVVWTPSNHNNITNGPITLRNGLEKSKNTVTIRIAEAIGVKAIRNIIIDSGINMKPENNLSIAIGSVESSLMDLARAYSAFVNEGAMPKTYLISSVKRADRGTDDKTLLGKMYFSDCDINAKCMIETEESINLDKISDLIDEADKTINVKYANVDGKSDKNEKNIIKKMTEMERDAKCVIFSPETAYQIDNMLQGAVARGTAFGLSGLGFPVAAKTGTSSKGKDMWTIAITPELVVAVFVGYDTPTETNNYGSQYALPVVREILLKMSDVYKFSDLKTPENIRFVKVNKNTGERASGESVKNVDSDNKQYIFEVFKNKDMLPKVEDSQDENIDITDL